MNGAELIAPTIELARGLTIGFTIRSTIAPAIIPTIVEAIADYPIAGLADLWLNGAIPCLSAPAILAASSAAGTIGDWQPRLSLLQEILALTWAINLLNWAILGRAMDWLAIRPRTQIGLLGIVFAPLLHGDVTHLFGNSLGFMVFGWMVLLYGEPSFWLVSAIVTLSSGLGVWLFGRGRVYALAEQRLYPIDLVHLGASGVIFGYFGFLLFISFFDRNPLSLILSLTVGVFYWNLLPGILPKQIGISWEAHLFGFLGGILAAWLLPAIARSP